MEIAADDCPETIPRGEPGCDRCRFAQVRMAQPSLCTTWTSVEVYETGDLEDPFSRSIMFNKFYDTIKNCTWGECTGNRRTGLLKSLTQSGA